MRTGIAQTTRLVTASMPSDLNHSNVAWPIPMNSTTSATRTPVAPWPRRLVMFPPEYVVTPTTFG